MVAFGFDNTYARDMDGFYAEVAAAPAPAPSLLAYNRDLATALGLPGDPWPDATAVFAGNTVPEGAQPLAQAYAGHQFGGFSPQLGDGRALLLGEVIDTTGARRDIQLKGSGRTPFSRGGDGKAGIGPVLREYLIGEAMHALGVPTTRALAAVMTGEDIYRDSGVQPGAVLTRVASSHIRVGTFQFFAARQQTEQLRQLLAYTIARHDPDLAPDDAIGLLRRVAKRQADLVARWMSLGFIHGVMNTDNSTVSGETIDYGPCAFMDTYAPATVYSSIDHGGRYAYANQPEIARWNLARLAESLLPLINADTDKAIASVTDVVGQMADENSAAHTRHFSAKLGLAKSLPHDAALIEDFLDSLEREKIDFTNGFARLVDEGAPHDPDWHGRWTARLSHENRSPEEALEKANPLVIPRNHKVEDALDAAQNGDIIPFEAVLKVVTRPFLQPEDASFTHPAPSDFGPYRTFCGT